MPETVYIVDVFSLLFQVFHAIPPMTGPKGQPTNAVFGFARDLQYLLNDKQPTYLICAMDSAGPAVRNDIYADYKANRSEMPEDLRPQIPMIQDLMGALGCLVIEHAGWEADDVIATATRAAVERGMQVRIVTSDKDARQLIGPQVQLYNVRKNSYLDESHLMADWGIRPDQVIDFQSLVGDAVDNVPGIPLVGPKKASALLNQFGTLEEVLAHADEAPGAKLRENLKAYAEQARMSRQLVALNTHLPFEVDWDCARAHKGDAARLLELYTEYGFRRLAEEAKALAAGQTDGQPAASGDKAAERQWETIDTADKFARFVVELRAQKRFCVDLETTGLNPVQADIVGWAFSWQTGRGHYIPVQGPPGQPILEPAAVADALRPILEDPAVEVVNQNIKYDMIVLRRAGIRVANIGLDPMVGDYLLDAGARTHGLDALADRYLQHRMIPIQELIGKGKVQKQMFEVDIPQAAEYAVEDADISWQLVGIITDELKKQGLWDLYWDLERPLIHVLADMEFTGIRVDVDELRRQSAEVGETLTQLIAEIHTMAGREFNIDSPKQLCVVLFDELGLPVQKRTKTGPSTDQEVLEKLAPLHALPAKIIEHRHLAKLKGTYLDALPQMVNAETGRIHASFNQVVAATGRLSSSDPNLQNIPVRTAEGRRVRRAFVPADTGWKLLSADYSQIELRMLAHFSEDEAMQQAFREGADIHTAVASEVFGVPLDQVDSSQRRIAKAVNFGVIYGQSPFGLAAALGIEQSEAATFIDNYFAKYAGVDRYLQQVLVEVEKTGYARTILGRRRPIAGIKRTTGRNRNMAERTAINTVIQGSAADLIKRAMLNIHARLARESHPARLLLQIHDELVFEVPEAQLDSLVKLVREEMENAMPLDVPLVVDVSVGDNWLDTEPVET